MLAVQALEAENRTLNRDLQELRAAVAEFKATLSAVGAGH